MSGEDDPFAGLDSAEAFLDAFAVPYDRAFLAVNRMRLLKTFRRELAALEGSVVDGPGQDRREAVRAALARAYADCASGNAAGGGRGAVGAGRTSNRTFVPLSTIIGLNRPRGE